MDISFKTIAQFNSLALDGMTEDNERHVSQYDLRRASGIAFAINHYLGLLECGHCVPHMGIGFKAKGLKPLKCNVLFQIHIVWAIFDEVQAEILLEWDEDERIIRFKEFKKDKRIKNTMDEKPPMHIIRIKKQIEPTTEVAKKIIDAISMTIHSIVEDAKNQAQHLGYSCRKLSKIIELA